MKGRAAVWGRRAVALLLAAVVGGAAAQEVTQGGSVAPPDDGAEEGPRHLIRAQFTSAMKGREPVDRIDQIESDRRRVYYFTEFRDLAGRTLAHRWEYQGRLMAEVRQRIDANRWRAWSSKRLLPQWEGEWQVSVVDEEGDVLRTDTLLVVPPAQ
ncbi:DUF2914 domain-containing protein [Endothiovibrio diazotrophicus]